MEWQLALAGTLANVEAEALVSILDYRQMLVMVAKLRHTPAKKKARSVVTHLLTN